MTRAELIEAMMRDFPQWAPHVSERVVTIVFENITRQLEQGGRVELRGFGAFTVRRRGERNSYNPKEGIAIKVEEKAVPFFKAGKPLLEKLNDR